MWDPDPKTPAVIRITSHTKIRKVKSTVESAIPASLVTRHFNLGVPEVTVKNYSPLLSSTLLLIIFITLKELIYTQGQMYNLKITNKSENIW